MMWWFENGTAGWAFPLMAVSQLVFWAVLVGAGVALFRSVNRASGPNGRSGRSTPEQLLAERFARGEIDEHEYRSRLDILRSATHDLPQ